MTYMIGFILLLGLICFAFGRNVARNVVRVAFILVGLVAAFIVINVTVAFLSRPQPQPARALSDAEGWEMLAADARERAAFDAAVARRATDPVERRLADEAVKLDAYVQRRAVNR
jgi:ABC-type enterobactin transport system permease subunit